MTTEELNADIAKFRGWVNGATPHSVAWYHYNGALAKLVKLWRKMNTLKEVAK